jgi:hypothetical protein
MKKLITILGYFFLALIAVFVAGIGSLAVVGGALDKQSKAFVDAAVPAIVSEWDVVEVRKRASAEYNEAVNYGDMEELFNAFQKLGKFEDYKGSTGDSTITVSLKYGVELTADYTANAEFEKGTVNIQMALIKLGGEWRILDLQMTPELFSQKKDII